MVIGSIARMAKQSIGEMASLVVAILTIGNAGVLLDKIGRRLTFSITLSSQAVLMLIAIPVVGSDQSSAVILVLLATFIDFNYGINISLFPSLTKVSWGLRNFGTKYGIVFTAWGVGGFVIGRLSQMLIAGTGRYTSSFLTATGQLLLGALLTFTLERERPKEPVIQGDAIFSYSEPN